MKQLYPLLLFLTFYHPFNAQYKLDVGIKLGASNYLGDIGGNNATRKDFLNDLKLAETKLSTGAFVRYRLLPQVSVCLSYNYGRIAGDDALSSNPSRKDRNLSFRNDIHELSLEGQYFFYSVNDLFHTYHFRNNFRTYIGTGVAVFHHNPQTFYEGEWIDLRPLRTEGELQPYSSFDLSIPFTAGFYFTFKNKYRMGWEIGWRKTFTDYLDDISGRYAPPSDLPNSLAVALANRTQAATSNAEMAANYAPGNKRGDPNHNDSYIFTTINFSYVFRGRSRQNSRVNWIKYGRKIRRTRHFPVKF